MPTSEYKYQTQAEMTSAFRASHNAYYDVPDDELYARIVKKYPSVPESIAENHDTTTSIANLPGLDKELQAGIDSAEAAGFQRPDGWFGPDLERPISAYENGREYMSVKETNEKGRRGFLEGFLDFGKEDAWFAGDFFMAKNIISNLSTLKKVNNGETVEPEDLIELNRYMEHTARLDNAKWHGMAGDIVRGSMKFAGEIATIIAGTLLVPGPEEAGLISSRFGGKAGKEAAEKAFKKYIAKNKLEGQTLTWTQRRLAQGSVNKAALAAGKQKSIDAVEKYIVKLAPKQAQEFLTKQGVARAGELALKESIARVGAKVAVTSAEIGAKGLVLTALNPGMTNRSIAQKKMENYLQYGNEDEKNAVMAGILDAWIENASEMSGAAMGAVAGRIVKKLPAKFRNAVKSDLIAGFFAKVNSGITGDPTLDAARKVLRHAGVNNILEEMAEERLGGFARGLLGVEGDAGLRNAIDRMIPDLKQASAETLAFALPGMAFTAAHTVRISKAFGGGGWRSYIDTMNRVNGNVSEKETDDRKRVVTDIEAEENLDALVNTARVESAAKIPESLARGNRKDGWLQKKFDKMGWSIPKAGTLDALLKDEQFATVRQIVDYADANGLDADKEVRDHLREVANRNMLVSASESYAFQRRKEVKSKQLKRRLIRSPEGHVKSVWYLPISKASDGSKRDSGLQKDFRHYGTIEEAKIAEQLGILNISEILPDAYSEKPGSAGYKVAVQDHRTLYKIKDYLEAEADYNATRAMMEAADATQTSWVLDMPFTLYDEAQNFERIDYAQLDVKPTDRVMMNVGASNSGGIIHTNTSTSLIDRIEDFIEASLETYYGRNLDETEAYNDLMASIQKKIKAAPISHPGWRQLKAFPSRSKELFVKLAISRRMGHTSLDRDMFDLLELEEHEEQLFDRLLSSAIPAATLTELSRVGQEFSTADRVAGEIERKQAEEDKYVEDNIDNILKAYEVGPLREAAKKADINHRGTKADIADRLLRSKSIKALTDAQADVIVTEKKRLKKEKRQKKAAKYKADVKSEKLGKAMDEQKTDPMEDIGGFSLNGGYYTLAAEQDWPAAVRTMWPDANASNTHFLVRSQEFPPEKVLTPESFDIAVTFDGEEGELLWGAKGDRLKSAAAWAKSKTTDEWNAISENYLGAGENIFDYDDSLGSLILSGTDEQARDAFRGALIYHAHVSMDLPEAGYAPYTMFDFLEAFEKEFGLTPNKEALPEPKYDVAYFDPKKTGHGVKKTQIVKDLDPDKAGASEFAGFELQDILWKVPGIDGYVIREGSLAMMLTSTNSRLNSLRVYDHADTDPMEDVGGFSLKEVSPSFYEHANALEIPLDGYKIQPDVIANEIQAWKEKHSIKYDASELAEYEDLIVTHDPFFLTTEGGSKAKLDDLESWIAQVPAMLEAAPGGVELSASSRVDSKVHAPVYVRLYPKDEDILLAASADIYSAVRDGSRVPITSNSGKPVKASIKQAIEEQRGGYNEFVIRMRPGNFILYQASSAAESKLDEQIDIINERYGYKGDKKDVAFGVPRQKDAISAEALDSRRESYRLSVEIADARRQLAKNELYRDRILEVINHDTGTGTIKVFKGGDVYEISQADVQILHKVEQEVRGKPFESNRPYSQNEKATRQEVADRMGISIRTLDDVYHAVMYERHDNLNSKLAEAEELILSPQLRLRHLLERSNQLDVDNTSDTGFSLTYANAVHSSLERHRVPASRQRELIDYWKPWFLDLEQSEDPMKKIRDEWRWPHIYPVGNTTLGNRLESKARMLVEQSAEEQTPDAPAQGQLFLDEDGYTYDPTYSLNFVSVDAAPEEEQPADSETSDGAQDGRENEAGGITLGGEEYLQKLSKYNTIFKPLDGMYGKGNGERIVRHVAMNSAEFEAAVNGTEAEYQAYINAENLPGLPKENIFREVLRNGVVGEEFGQAEGQAGIPRKYAKGMHTFFSAVEPLTVIHSRFVEDEHGEETQIVGVSNRYNRVQVYTRMLEARRDHFVEHPQYLADQWEAFKQKYRTDDKYSPEMMEFFTGIPAAVWKTSHRLKVKTLKLKQVFNKSMSRRVGPNQFEGIIPAINKGSTEEAQTKIREMYDELLQPGTLEGGVKTAKADIQVVAEWMGGAIAINSQYPSVVGKSLPSLRQDSQMIHTVRELKNNPNVNEDKDLPLTSFLFPYDGRTYPADRTKNRASDEMSAYALMADSLHMHGYIKQPHPDEKDQTPKPVGYNLDMGMRNDDYYLTMFPRFGAKSQVYFMRVKKYNTPAKRAQALKQYTTRYNAIIAETPSLRGMYISPATLESYVAEDPGGIPLNHNSWHKNGAFLFDETVNNLILQEALLGEAKQYMKSKTAHWTATWYEQTKRATQVPTPGIPMTGTFRYMVFDDNGKTDGDYWYSDAVAKILLDHLGSSETPGRNSVDSLKAHVSSVKDKQRLLFKGLGHKLSEMAKLRNGYDVLDQWLRDYNEAHKGQEIGFIMSASAAKYHGIAKENVSQGWLKVDGPRVTFDREAMDAAPVHTDTFEGKDMFMSQWLNYEQTPKLVKDSIQFESAISHFRGAEHASKLYNELLEREMKRFDEWGPSPFYIEDGVKKSHYLDPIKDEELWDELVVNELDWRGPNYEEYKWIVFRKLNKMAERQTNRVDLQKVAPLNTNLGSGIHLNDGKVVLPLVSHTARRKIDVMRPAIGGFKTFGEAVAYVEKQKRRFQDLHDITDKGTFDLRFLRTHEIEERGEMGWVIPGELFMENRIPNDALHSGMPSRTYNVVHHENHDWDRMEESRRVHEANWSMSDLVTSMAKGEDNDGDVGKATLLHFVEHTDTDGTTYMRIDMSRGKTGLINMAQLAMWSGYLDPSNVKHIKDHSIDLKLMDDLIINQKKRAGESLPAANSPAGWEHLQQLYSKGDEALKIFARSASVMDLFSSHDVSYTPPAGEEVHVRDSGWMVFAPSLSRNKDAKILLRNELGTFLTNLALDDAKDPRLHWLNLDKKTAGLVMPLVFANGYLDGTLTDDYLTDDAGIEVATELSEKRITDYMRYAKQVVHWLQTSEVVAAYQTLGMKFVNENKSNFSKADVKRLKAALALSEDWMKLSSYLDIPKSAPNTYEEYRKHRTSLDAIKLMESGGHMLSTGTLLDAVTPYTVRNREIAKRRKRFGDEDYRSTEKAKSLAVEYEANEGEAMPDSMLEERFIKDALLGSYAPVEETWADVQAAQPQGFLSALELRHDLVWSDEAKEMVASKASAHISMNRSFRAGNIQDSEVERMKAYAKQVPVELLTELAYQDQLRFGFRASPFKGSLWQYLPTEVKAELNERYIAELERWKSAAPIEAIPETPAAPSEQSVEETSTEDLPPVITEELDSSDAGQQDFAFSLNYAETTVDHLLPFKYMGAHGLHTQYIEAMRQIRDIMHGVSMEVEDLKVEVGAKQKLGAKKAERYDQKTIELGNLMLDAVTLYIESGIHKQFNGSMNMGTIMYDRYGKPIKGYNTVADVFIAYNKNAKGKKLKLITAEEATRRARGMFEKGRDTANKSVPLRMGRDFIEEIPDFYVKHKWWGFYLNGQRTKFGEGEAPRPPAGMAEKSTAQGSRRVESYQKGFSQEKRLIAETLNVADLYQSWAQDVYAKRMRRILLTSATGMREASGMPAVVFIPKSGGNTRDPKNRGVAFLDEATHRLAGEQLAQYLDVPFNPTKNVTEQLRTMFHQLKAQNPNAYRIIDNSRIDSVGEVYAAKGVAYNTMQMLIGQNYQAKLLKAIERFNAWAKFMAIGVPLMSLFHPAALMESGGAAEGLTKKNMLLPWNWKKTWELFETQYKQMRNNPELLSVHIQSGMLLDVSAPDFQMGIIEHDLNRLQEVMDRKAREGGRLPQKGAQALHAYRNQHDRWQSWMWKKVLPVLKFHTAEQVFLEVTDSLREQGIPIQDTQIRRDISRYVNKAFGGLEMEAMTWATPRARQMLHMFMFAPDWTMAAAQISSITNAPVLRDWLRTQQSPIESNQMARRYWPAMAAIVLGALPNILQSAIWATTRLGGDPDDVPFTFLNEDGKKFHVDITPLVRHFGWVPGLGYEGGDTGKRRVYLRWGKQAFEVFDGWLSDPAHTLLNKTSMIFKTAYEQVTSLSVNGWELPFKDQGLAGALVQDGSVLDSRAGYVVRKFIPFTVLAAIEDQPIGFFAPSSKGASKWRLTTDMAALLTLYANDDTVIAMQKKGLEHKVKAVAPEIIDAAIRNGYDPQKVVSRAVASVRSKLYGKFFRALNKGDLKEAERIAPSIVRLNGTVKSVHKSMIDRMAAANRPFTEEHSAIIHDLIGRK